MKFRTFVSTLAIAAAALFILGIAGFWGLTQENSRDLLRQSRQPTATQFVPRQAPLMVSLLARPDRLWQLRQLLTAPEHRAEARQEWQTLQHWLTETSGLDYTTDVQPWLGNEITFSVTSADLDRNADNGQQPGYLWVLSSQDNQQAREALHLFWQQRALAGEELVFEPQAGVNLIYNRSGEASPSASLTDVPIASAMVGDRYVLLANHPRVLRQALITAQTPDLNLQGDGLYRQLVERSQPRVGWFYSNLPEAMHWLGETSPATPAPGKAPAAEGQLIRGIFASLRLTETGLVADTALSAMPGTAFPEAPMPQSQEQELVAQQWLPDSTLLAVSGTHLDRFRQSLRAVAGGYAPVRRSLERLEKALRDPIAAEDLTPWLHWMQGEYALALLPDHAPNWLLASQQPQSGDDAIETLDTLAQRQGLAVGRVPLNDHTATVWSQFSLPSSTQSGVDLQAKVMLAHTPVAGYELFATSLNSLQQALEAPQQGALDSNADFQASAAMLPESDAVKLYLNWPQLKPYLLNDWPWLRVIEQGGQPLTAHLGAIAVSNYRGDRYVQEGRVAVHLTDPPLQSPDL